MLGNELDELDELANSLWATAAQLTEALLGSEGEKWTEVTDEATPDSSVPATQLVKQTLDPEETVEGTQMQVSSRDVPEDARVCVSNDLGTENLELSSETPAEADYTPFWETVTGFFPNINTSNVVCGDDLSKVGRQDAMPELMDSYTFPYTAATVRERELLLLPKRRRSVPETRIVWSEVHSGLLVGRFPKRMLWMGQDELEVAEVGTQTMLGDDLIGKKSMLVPHSDCMQNGVNDMAQFDQQKGGKCGVVAALQQDVLIDRIQGQAAEDQAQMSAGKAQVSAQLMHQTTGKGVVKATLEQAFPTAVQYKQNVVNGSPQKGMDSIRSVGKGENSVPVGIIGDSDTYQQNALSGLQHVQHVHSTLCVGTIQTPETITNHEIHKAMHTISPCR